MEKKIFNHVFVSKKNDEVAFAKLEGLLSSKKDDPTRAIDLTVSEVNSSTPGETIKLAKATLVVSNKVKAKLDYALGRYQKGATYPERSYVTIVAWGNKAELLESKIRIAEEQKAKAEAEGRTLIPKFELYGDLKEVTYNKNNDSSSPVSYLELTLDRFSDDCIKMTFVRGKSSEVGS